MTLSTVFSRDCAFPCVLPILLGGFSFGKILLHGIIRFITSLLRHKFYKVFRTRRTIFRLYWNLTKRQTIEEQIFLCYIV